MIHKMGLQEYIKDLFFVFLSGIMYFTYVQMWISRYDPLKSVVIAHSISNLHLQSNLGISLFTTLAISFKNYRNILNF